MIEKLKEIDTSLFFFFNHLNNSIFDFLFYWISDKWIWIPFYAFLAWLIVKHYNKNIVWILLFIAAAITVSDQVASAVIKEHVMRLRPCHNPAIMSQVHIVNGYCGGQFGFISSHASNTFTLAAFLSRILKKPFTGFSTMLWVWATVVSFSRIYLGVHYPADVFCAALLGIATGSVFAMLCEKTLRKYSLINRNK